MSLRRLTPILTAIAMAVALTGCGGSSAPQETPAAAETPAGTVVPDVVGQKGDEARDALEDAGFDVEWGNETVVMASNWTVDEQDPAAGESAPEGATVTLTVSKPTESEAPTTPTIASDLAARTEAAYLNAWGVDSLLELAGDPNVTVPVASITQWEDVSAGTIRVYVQEPLSRDEAKTVGQNIWGLTNDVVTDLATIVVRGADGIDVNYFG